MAFTYCTNCGEKIDDSVEKCPHCNHPKGGDRVYGYAPESFGKKDAENGEGRGSDATGSTDGRSGGDGQSPYGQSGSGQNQNGQNPYGQSPYGQNGGGQNQYGQNPYGQSGNGRGGNPWENRQNPYGQNPYGQNRNPWENGQNGYGQGGPWQSPYGAPWQPRERRKASVGLIIFSIINILFGTCCAGSIFGIIGLVFAITAKDAPTELEEIRRKKISLAINIIAVVLTVAFIVSASVALIQNGGLEAFWAAAGVEFSQT